MNDPHESEEVAVAEPVVSTRETVETDRRTATRRQPPYNVIILNDEEHTFEYVIEMLVKLFGHPAETARQLTLKVHTTGRAVVYTTHRERAELKREQVLAYGPDPRMEISKGPIGCYIEPAPID